MKTKSWAARAGAALAGCVAFAAAACQAQTDGDGEAADRGEIVRAPIPGSDFPIALAVTTPPEAETLYVSGVVPQIVDPDADPNSRAAYGDTRQQTVTVLQAMQERMEALGWSLGDIVMMRVYLVGDEATDGRMDFAGFMEGYTQFFATPDQPNTPARAVVEVAGLARPGWRVEIEAQAARVGAD